MLRSTGTRNWNLMLRLFRGNVGPDLMFMDDNACPHRAQLVDAFLQGEEIQHMEWPASLVGYESDRACMGSTREANFIPSASTKDHPVALN